MAEELIVFPDLENVVPDFLTAEFAADVDFDSIEAYGRVPKSRPAEFVLVTVVGGADRDIVSETPTIVIEGWAGTDTRAAAIAGRARAYMLRAGRTGRLGTAFCYSVETLSRPQRLPDPVSSQTRYTATYAVPLRGSGA